MVLQGFNKVMSLQKLLQVKNAYGSLLPCSSSHIRRLLLQNQRTWSQSSSITISTLASLPLQLQNSQYARAPRRHLSCSARKLSVKDSAVSSSHTVDEFRAREQQREDEFARQQEAQQARHQADSADETKRAKIDAIRSQILEAALPHVPTLGWTRNAIVQGAEETGFPSVVHGIFPEGGFALVSYFNGKCNEALLQHLQAETQNGQQTVADPLDFLVRAVRMRLKMIEPYKGQWPQALALIALPQNTSTALAQVLTLVDDICYYSGDRSVDIGWYTRRIGLATILKMTELYMLQDSSPHHANTWEFLKNRVDEAVQLQMMLSQTGDVTDSFQRSFNSAFVTARNILGLGYNRS